MSPKNETRTLVISFLVALGILSGGLWWLFQMRLDGTDSPPVSSNGSQALSEAPRTFNAVENIPTGSFDYSGSRSWTLTQESIDPILKQTYPEFRLRYEVPVGGKMSSGRGIEMLLADERAFALTSRPLKPEEVQAAAARGYQLEMIPVAMDGIAIVVNPNLDVSGLTIAQLQGIYTGQITNWEAVGGTNRRIIPYTQETGEIVSFFREEVLSGEAFASTVQKLDSHASVLSQVAQTPGAIYYGLASDVVRQCAVKALPLGRQGNQLIPPYQQPLVSEMACREQGQRNQLNAGGFQRGDYPLTRRLFVIVKADGSSDQKAGEAYATLLLTEQGQNLIRSSGLVRLP
jgi:phosphate transport system substrate-binding protein